MRSVTAWIGRNAMALTLLVVAVYAVGESLHWSYQVRLAPMSTAAAFGVFALITIFQEGRGRRAEAREDAEAQERADAFSWDDYRGFLWYLAAFACVVLFGMQAGLLIAIALISRVALGSSNVMALILTIAAAGVIWLFDSFFRVFWFEPYILRLF